MNGQDESEAPDADAGELLADFRLVRTPEGVAFLGMVTLEACCEVLEYAVSLLGDITNSIKKAHNAYHMEQDVKDTLDQL